MSPIRHKHTRECPLLPSSDPFLASPSHSAFPPCEAAVPSPVTEFPSFATFDDSLVRSVRRSSRGIEVSSSPPVRSERQPRVIALNDGRENAAVTSVFASVRDANRTLLYNARTTALLFPTRVKSLSSRGPSYRPCPFVSISPCLNFLSILSHRHRDLRPPFFRRKNPRGTDSGGSPGDSSRA